MKFDSLYWFFSFVPTDLLIRRLRWTLYPPWCWCVTNWECCCQWSVWPWETGNGHAPPIPIHRVTALDRLFRPLLLLNVVNISFCHWSPAQWINARIPGMAPRFSQAVHVEWQECIDYVFESSLYIPYIDAVLISRKRSDLKTSIFFLTFSKRKDDSRERREESTKQSAFYVSPTLHPGSFYIPCLQTYDLMTYTLH